VLVIGHNPMMEDLAFAVAGNGSEIACAALNSGFPTSGLAVIDFPGSLVSAAPGKGYLEAFITPADL
jgi:phosphohistidine phosphatase